MKGIGHIASALLALAAALVITSAPVGAYYDEWSEDPLYEAWEEEFLTDEEYEQLNADDPSIENPLAKKGEKQKPLDKVRVCDFGEQSTINFWVVTPTGKQMCSMLGGTIVWVAPYEDDPYKPMFWL